MSALDSDDEVGAFEHRLTDATLAPRASGSIPNSVFALGGSAPAPAPVKTKQRAIRGMAARAVLAIDACGPLDAGQIAEAVGITRQQAHGVAHHGVDCGYLVRHEGVGGKPSTYSLTANAKERAQPPAPTAPETTGAMKGFKAWLTKAGETSAEGRAPRATRAGPATVPARSAAASPAPVAAAAPPAEVVTLRYAMFNDGTLRIEAGDASLTLPPEQARELLAYATKVSQALGGLTAA